VPPDEKPRGAKIPEPATLALFGAGMITTARVLRIKRQSKYRLRTITERFSRAQLQSVAGDTIRSWGLTVPARLLYLRNSQLFKGFQRIMMNISRMPMAMRLPGGDRSASGA